ncbi:hypothetical protein JFK97_01955 [Chromobacterium phragmitis]|uniref:hypothetical protein n=1 Tax=Chromobacterium amazonense TaxID=1382803 RepID=UPI0021B7BDB6|nr:hypothetical protein [Chromobacterium amazonense]MBM2883143.1 hypothetical protein [Chromobacterium amazonense]MDE1712797.1 hypothetical protein [Chromobacterium amazonense]
MSSQFNEIFRQLVPPNSSDFVGMVAYALYKKQKIEWIERFASEHEGRTPTQEDLQHFHRVSTMPSQIQAYREQAVNLLDEFLDYALSDKVEQIRQDMQQDALVKAFANTEEKLLDKQETHHQSVMIAITKPWYKAVWENLLAGGIASLVTIAAAGLIWAAAQGPEKLFRETLTKLLQPTSTLAHPNRTTKAD